MDMLSNVIHPASEANFTGYTYTQVYAGAAATPTVNGVVVAMAAGHNINILVQSISSTANVYVIGYKKIIAPSVING